jgi:hypothetical protein
MTDYANKQAFKRGRIARKIWRWIQARSLRTLEFDKPLEFEIQTENGLDYVRPRRQVGQPYENSYR